MAYYFIQEDDDYFPHPDLTDSSGILCIGGDLKPERLLLAYQHGIFPWYNEGEPIMWWSPDPRFVLYPDKLKVSKSMRPYFNQQKFELTFNQDFPSVIHQCKIQSRAHQHGTWITDAMEEAYIRLHELGHAHSVEVLKDGKLVGGLYGVAVGKVFSGESMFSLEKNASKFGFISLVRKLIEQDFTMIDCQQETGHLASLGAEAISRTDFLNHLNDNQKYLNKKLSF